MSNYIDLVEESLQKNKRTVEESYQKAIEDVSDEDLKYDIGEHYSELYSEASNYFPKLLANTFVISWYSFVEQKLLDFCEEQKLTIKIGPKDRENIGKGVLRAKHFLQKAKNYEIDNSHWEELMYIKNVRNILVHEGDNIRASFKKPDKSSVTYEIDEDIQVYLKIDNNLHVYLQKHNIITRSGSLFELTSNVSYCKYLIEFAKQFFSQLYANISPRTHTI